MGAAVLYDTTCERVTNMLRFTTLYVAVERIYNSPEPVGSLTSYYSIRYSETYRM